MGLNIKNSPKWENYSLGYIGSIGISRPMNQDEARIINDFVRSKSVLLATKKLVGDLERNDKK